MNCVSTEKIPGDFGNGKIGPIYFLSTTLSPLSFHRLQGVLWIFYARVCYFLSFPLNYSQNTLYSVNGVCKRKGGYEMVDMVLMKMNPCKGSLCPARVISLFLLGGQKRQVLLPSPANPVLVPLAMQPALLRVSLMSVPECGLLALHWKCRGCVVCVHYQAGSGVCATNL